MNTWNSLWIEAGEMSGGSRNQIEFDEALASFFFAHLPGIGQSEDLQIGARQRWLECGLAGKRTTFGVDIYRLSLPTVTRGGFDYAGRVVMFTRNGPPGSRYFQCEVVDLGSPEHDAWRNASIANGTLDRTAGGASREYGFLQS